MPEIPPPDRTEELLRGADRPRPLPSELRQRLADQLIEVGRQDATAVAGASGTAGARPLPSELRARLEHALPSEPSYEEEEGDGRRRWRNSRWTNPVTAVAAALLLLVAVVGLSIHGGGSNRGHVAATSSAGKGARGLPPSASLSAGGAGSSVAGAGGSSLSSAAGPLNGAAGNTTGQSAAGSAAAGSAGGTSGGAAAPGPAPSAVAPEPPPSVSRITPTTGPTAGGTWVTVTGQNLGGATLVHFGTTAARQLVVVSGTELRALSPAHVLGMVDVTVKTPGGTSPVTPADRYTYLP